MINYHELPFLLGITFHGKMINYITKFHFRQDSPHYFFVEIYTPTTVVSSLIYCVNPHNGHLLLNLLCKPPPTFTSSLFYCVNPYNGHLSLINTKAGPAKSGALCENLKWDPILQEKLKYSTNIRYMFYYLHDNGNIKTLLFVILINLSIAPFEIELDSLIFLLSCAFWHWNRIPLILKRYIQKKTK
jgi:hypothetical protein